VMSRALSAKIGHGHNEGECMIAWRQDETCSAWLVDYVGKETKRAT
jgi:hypothetical protein